MLNTGGEQHSNNLTMFQNWMCHVEYIGFEAMIESSCRSRLEPFFTCLVKPLK